MSECRLRKGEGDRDMLIKGIDDGGHSGARAFIRIDTSRGSALSVFGLWLALRDEIVECGFERIRVIGVPWREHLF